MKKFMFLLIPFALACGAAKVADGEACSANDDCESGHCHVEEGAAEGTDGVCEAADDDDADAADTATSDDGGEG